MASKGLISRFNKHKQFAEDDAIEWGTPDGKLWRTTHVNGVYTLEERIGDTWYLCQLPPMMDCVMHGMRAFHRELLRQRHHNENQEAYVEQLRRRLR